MDNNYSDDERSVKLKSMLEEAMQPIQQRLEKIEEDIRILKERL